MSKINVKSKLNNLTDDQIFDANTKGIFIDNKIKYIDNLVTVVLEIKDDKILLNRTNDDYSIYIEFMNDKKTTGKYEVNNLGTFNLKIETKKLEIKSNEINIIYSMCIEDVIKDFDYKIIYEECKK